MRSWSRRRKFLTIGGSILGVLIVIIIIVNSLPESEATKARNIEATRVVEEAATAATKTAVAERLIGFHCLNPLDGNHDGLEALIRDQLKDPDSMETIETRISPMKDGQHDIILSFRARNPIGGMVVSTAIGKVSTTSCQASLISIE